MNLIQIKCPHCLFEKDVERLKIPDDIKSVNCPKCRRKFFFELPGEEFVIEEIPVDQEKLEKKQAALKHIKNGMIAACISGGVTIIVSLLAILTGATGSLGYWNDPLVFIDVILIFICAFGLYKKSRVAAVLLFVYFIFAKILIGIETQSTSGLFVGVIFIYFYGRAVQGTYAYHAFEKDENPHYKATPKWVYITGVPVLVLFLAMMVLGILTMTGVMPSTEVLAGAKIPESELELLYAENIIEEGEQIEYFYSTGFTSVLEGGTIMTGDSVILYLPEGQDDIGVYEIPFEDITTIEQIQKGDYWEDSVYQISTSVPDAWLQIVLSTENDGDKKFIEALRAKVPQ